MFSAKVREKSIGKMKSNQLLAVFLVPMVALILGGAVSKGWAQESFFNIELNATDLDVGVRGFFDDDPWKELEIENPRGRTISEDESRRGLKRQGKAEWFFESGEPPLDEVSFRRFLRRFPEGDYIFEAELIEGGEVDCVEELTHVIPCPPVVSYDDSNREISWVEVTQVVDTEMTDANVADGIGDPPIEEVACEYPEPDDEFEIDGYEVIVEGSKGDLSVTLPAGDTSFTVPTEVGSVDKFEVLAIEASGNQTITEVDRLAP